MNDGVFYASGQIAGPKREGESLSFLKL